MGIIVLAVAAIQARSVALAGFGLDGLIELSASAVVLCELADIEQGRQCRVIRLIGGAFLALAAHLVIQRIVVLGHRAC